MNVVSEPSLAPPTPSSSDGVVYLETREGLLARFPDGGLVKVTRSRARTYPRLCSEAPPTGPLYEAAAQELAGAKRAVDLGCGSGQGSRILHETIADVIGVDVSDDALLFARSFEPEARFLSAEDFERGAVRGADSAVIVDLLGHVESPFALLRRLRGQLPAGSRVVVAEPAGYPAQSLTMPARRAFSVRSLGALLAASSFAVRDWICDDGTFLACVAVAVEDTGADALAEGAVALAAGDIGAALRAYHVASVSSRAEVQLEAQLSLADIHVARGEGDDACRAYFRAREIDGSDARPLAGLAQVSLAIGYADDARVLAAKAAQLDPAEPIAAGVLAMTLEAGGAGTARDETVPVWRAASNLAPDNLQFACCLAQAALRKNESALALQVLERVRSYGDDHGAALHFALANALKAAGRMLDARLEARMALARAPLEPEVQRLWKELQP